MKRIQILPFALLLLAVAALSSCSPGREYYSQRSPRYRSSLSLIIAPSPGFRMDTYPDGRFYYRSPQGYTYWRGNDNRFYLDREYLNRVHYNQREYNEWNRYNRGYNRRRHY
jgi:hypothetical protein